MKENRYWLMKVRANWADEIKVYSFRLCTDIEKNEFQQKIEQIKNYIAEGNYFHFPVGSNQSVEFCKDTYMEIDNNFKFLEISKIEYDLIKKLFSIQWGHNSLVDIDFFEIN